MKPRYGTPPEQLERALRDLLRGWQEVVSRNPTATDDYRALTRRAILRAEAALKEGGPPYHAVIFALAPVFAAADEATVEVVVRPDDEGEAATVRRAVQAGTERFQARGHGGRVSAPVYVEISNTPAPAIRRRPRPNTVRRRVSRSSCSWAAGRTP